MMSVTKQYLFEVYVEIHTNGGILKYVHNNNISQSMDIEFSLPFDNTSDRSVGEVTIWNMSKISFNRISQGNHIVIKARSEEHTSELQSRFDLVCRLLLEKKKMNKDERIKGKKRNT